MFGLCGGVGGVQVDVHDGLETDVEWTLKEVEKTASAFGAKTPTLSVIIKLIEDRTNKGEGVQLIMPEELYR